jgi:hypothetical protein
MERGRVRGEFESGESRKVNRELEEIVGGSFGEERDGSVEAGEVAQFCGEDLGTEAADPDVFVHVMLDEGDDEVGGLDDASADDDDVGIVGVDIGDGDGGPDLEAVLLDGESDGVSVSRMIEELLEADVMNAGEGAAGKAGPVAGGERHGPAGGFGLGAADVAAGAVATVEV